jgi:hypothetical protein
MKTAIHSPNIPMGWLEEVGSTERVVVEEEEKRWWTLTGG